MRSPAEIHFRLKQELHNLTGYLRPPRLPNRALNCEMERLLPNGKLVADALAGTSYSVALIAQADRTLHRDFALLGRDIDVGPEIHWDRDYLSDIEWTGSGFLRRIPYLDAQRVGDHKVVWELNRHQHLPLLAQAWLLTGRRDYLEEAEQQVLDWIDQHPYARGMQWVSALEVAFRLLSWLWLWHLAQKELSAKCRAALLQAIWQHATFLERNLSIYYSPNTHLLGEAIALHAVGRLFPQLPHAERWRETGGRIVAEQVDRQLRDDGSYFEQSSYYHVYACDFFLFHALLEGPSPAYRDRLRKAGQYLWDLLGPAGKIPYLGDDDGGRFFHPYGARTGFGRATLVALGAYLNEPQWRGSTQDTAEIAAWWMGPGTLDDTCEPWRPSASSAVYPMAKVATLWRGDLQVIIDIAGFGPLPAGHSHAHALSVVVRQADQDLLTDPGTFSYTGSPHWRQVFRSTPMHNTLVIAGADQAPQAGPFRWESQPECEVVHADAAVVEAVCRYNGFAHTRRVELEADRIVVTDSVDGPDRPTQVEQYWHPGLPTVQSGSHQFRLGESATLTLSEHVAVSHEHAGAHGWLSPCYGIKTESDVLKGIYESKLPMTFRSEIILEKPSV